MNELNMTPDIDVVAHWGLSHLSVKPFVPVGRIASEKGPAWLVNESFLLKSDDASLFEQREYERRLCLLLDIQNIPVLIPKKNKTVKHGGRIYGLFDYVPQRHPEKIDYQEEFTKAEKIGMVLAKISLLKSRSPGRELFQNRPSIKETIKKTLPRIDRSLRDITHAVQHLHEYLNEQLFSFLPFLEQRFCHGDFHPANILWQDDRIRAVIDWEKAGMREELYDLALLIGCVGMDEPSELTGDWIKRLLRVYLKNTETTKLSFELLPELVLAIRMNWMALWMSSPEDFEIAKMEALYWKLIIKNKEEIKSHWKSCLENDLKYSKTKWVMQDAWMVEEINRAKQRMRDKDIYSHGVELLEFKEEAKSDQLSTDLRLLSIERGMADDILNVCKILNQQKRLSLMFPESDYIKIEYVLTMGNTALDFSKFRMIYAMGYILKECAYLMKHNPGLEELKIGYAFILRNLSILLAEIGDYRQAAETVEEHIHLYSENPGNLDIKEELARSLSNAVTTIIQKGMKSFPPDAVKNYTGILSRLYQEHPDSKKIKVAYSVALANMKKAKVSPINHYGK